MFIHSMLKDYRVGESWPEAEGGCPDVLLVPAGSWRLRGWGRGEAGEMWRTWRNLRCPPEWLLVLPVHILACGHGAVGHRWVVWLCVTSLFPKSVLRYVTETTPNQPPPLGALPKSPISGLAKPLFF